MANSELPPGSKGTIPVPLAKQEVQNWYDYLAKDTSDLDVKSFEIDILIVKDLIEKNPDANGIRLYPALRTADDTSSLTLILVPTIDGKDIIHVTLPGGGVGGEDDDSNIYNFTKKCPPACPTGPENCFMTA